MEEDPSVSCGPPPTHAQTCVPPHTSGRIFTCAYTKSLCVLSPLQSDSGWGCAGSSRQQQYPEPLTVCIPEFHWMWDSTPIFPQLFLQPLIPYSHLPLVSQILASTGWPGRWGISRCLGRGAYPGESVTGSEPCSPYLLFCKMRLRTALTTQHSLSHAL